MVAYAHSSFSICCLFHGPTYSGHAIRKAAVGLGKKLHGNKRQAQSLAKRRLKNKGDFETMNALNMNMNGNDFLDKAALMNGVNLNNGLAGISNDMGLSSMNMNMNVNMNMNMGALNNLAGRNPLMGVPNIRNNAGIMGAMGLNGVGMGMNPMAPISYSRELEEMLVMNRLRSEVGNPADSSILGSFYANGKAPGDAGALSGLNMMAGMDDSAMLEELQRRKLRLDAAAKKEEAMNMLRESDQMTRWADHNTNNNKPSLMNDAAVDFNNNPSGIAGMNGALGNNRANPGMSFMGMPGLGGTSGNLDNMNSNNLDSVSSSLLSKLASGNAKMPDQLLMQGASNFGNNDNNNMANTLMNLNTNIGTTNESQGGNNGQLPISNNGLSSQYNYDMP
jgi:hypothetical protein